MDCADSRAGQHRIGRLRDHRHVQDDTVTLAHAQVLQDVGKLADAGVQLPVGDVLRLVTGLVRLPDDRSLVTARGQMAVDAVGRDVQRAVLVPADVDVSGGEGGVLDGRVGPYPVQPPPVLVPERRRVGDRGGIHGVVRRAIGMGARHDGVGRGIGLGHRRGPPVGMARVRSPGIWRATPRRSARPRPTRRRPPIPCPGSPPGQRASARRRRSVPR